MIIKRERELTFTNFYLLEFFNQILEKGKDIISEDQYLVLCSLGDYMTRESDVIPALEKLARLQGTNELSIFLFDMVGRIEDYSSEMIYATLPDLADDFVNLYNLMIEEPESSDDMKTVISDFEKHYGPVKIEDVVDKTPIQEEPAELAEAAVEKETLSEIEEDLNKEESPIEPTQDLKKTLLPAEGDWLSFSDFYHQEYSKKLESKLRENRKAAESKKIIKLIKEFAEISQELSPKNKGSFKKSLLPLLESQAKLGVEAKDSPPNPAGMIELDKNIAKLVDKFTALEKAEPDLIDIFLKNGVSPDLLQEEAKILPPEELPEKPVTIDNILLDYFKSEVEDHLEQIQIFLKDESYLKQPQVSHKKLIRQFRSLKEISMIHGYIGMEYGISMIITRLEIAAESHRYIAKKSNSPLGKLLGELGQIEKFTDSPNDDPQIEKLKKLLDKIDTTLVMLDIGEEQAPDKEPEAESVEKSAPISEFTFSDKIRVKETIRELLTKLNAKLSTEQAKLRNKDKRGDFVEKNQQISNALRLFVPEVSKNFLDQLCLAYEYIFEQPVKLHKGFFDNLENVWIEFFEIFDNDNDLSLISESLKKLRGIEEEDLFGITDVDIGSIFVDTHQKIFDLVRDKIDSAFVRKSKSAMNEISSFLLTMQTNLSLIGFKTYLPAIQYSKDLLRDGVAPENSSDINSFFIGLLSIIKSKGHAGNADELIEKLKQTFEKAGPEPVSPEDSTEVDEDDVEDIFKKEFSLYHSDAVKSLKIFQKDNTNREALKQIEQSVHSIKMASQILSKNRISELASPIEDIAELYGQSTIPIPSDLPDNFKKGLDDLKKLQKNSEYDIDETVEMLDQILDRIMIEDTQPHTEVASEDQPVSEQVQKDKDDTLFLEKEDIDQDLVDIFQEEAATYLKILRDEIASLGNGQFEEDSLNSLESSAHSLRSAAKMMGFRDIANLSAKIEEEIVDIKQKSSSPSESTIQAMHNTLDAIEIMSSGRKMSAIDLKNLLAAFQASKAEAVSLENNVDDLPKTETMAELDGFYFEEAHDIIRSLNEDLVQMEKLPESELLLGNILRHLHTLKGSSMMLKLEKIGHLCHRLEDYFELYKEQPTGSKEEMIGSVFRVVDLIEDLVEKIKGGGPEEAANYTGILAEINNKLFVLQNSESGVDPGQIISGTDLPRPAPVRVVKGDENFLKVTTSYIDNLVNMATDLVVNRTELSTEYTNLKKLLGEIEAGKRQIYQTGNMLDNLLEQEISSPEEIENVEKKPEELQEISTNFRKLVRKVNDVTSELERLSQNFDKNIGRITNLSNLLHNNILRVRMIPVEFLFERFSRPVRDLAHSLGKKVNLNFEGSDTEMDRAMIEALVDPILHIVRNSVDHGVETEEQRKKLKKDTTARITLKARRDKNQVVIEVQDDGRGIDIKRVTKEIIKRKLKQKKEVEKFSEGEILEFLFYPEFSTTKEVSKVSGRGIGLDVVSRQIQQLKGNIRIKTDLNVGTTFSIRVPLTLVISQAMMTKCQGQNIAIPVSAVQESVNIESTKIINEDEKTYIKIRDTLLPYVSLDDVLTFGENAAHDNVQTAVIINDAGISIAVGVPSIEGRQEIVIKALGSHLQNVEYISGGTILGNGEIALILDYAAVIRTVELQFFGDQKSPAAPQLNAKAKPDIEKVTDQKKKMIERSPREISGRNPVILIVDDSVSVRNFVGSILEKEGFEILTAESGNEALEISKEKIADLIITDLEMPNMDGFTLISNLRAKEDFDHVPIIILTGKSGSQQQSEGMERGADAFVTKPFKEDELIRIVKKYIIVK